MKVRSIQMSQGDDFLVVSVLFCQTRSPFSNPTNQESFSRSFSSNGHNYPSFELVDELQDPNPPIEQIMEKPNQERRLKYSKRLET